MPGLLEPGDTVLVKASRGVGLERVTQALVDAEGAAPDPRRRGRRLMGEVLIGGTAALLLCVFLSPRFIDFMRERQFGQHIREEGPEHHQTKAGTPTMGGLIIFVAISVPFLILTDGDWRAVGVFGTALACAAIGFADDYTKIVRRRSLGLQGRTKLVLLVLISLALWWVADASRPTSRPPCGCASSTPASTSGSSSRCSSTS